MTHEFTISIGGPAYGCSFAAYVKSDAPGYSGEPCIGVGASPEEASTDAQRHIALTAAREGFGCRIRFSAEN